MPYTPVRLFRTGKGEVPVQAWLEELESRDSRAHEKCLERILRLQQFGRELRRPLAAPLRDGVYELRVRIGRLNYRILYFFCGANVARLSHGLTKERTVPASEIDLAVQRKKMIESNPDKHTAEWGN